MTKPNKNLGRRSFVKSSCALTLATTTGVLPLTSTADTAHMTQSNNINMVGPRDGYTPHVGTLVSMLNWMRGVMLRPVRGLNIRQLDYLLDDNSNSIGAMLLHLAATELFYQRNTFDGNVWPGSEKISEEMWDAAMNLGDEGRRLIKGNDLDFYFDILEGMRNHTLELLKGKDDDWLQEYDNFWSSPTNNYCKWFHVCEHESNHNGQIKYIVSRIPA